MLLEVQALLDVLTRSFPVLVVRAVSLSDFSPLSRVHPLVCHLLAALPGYDVGQEPGDFLFGLLSLLVLLGSPFQHRSWDFRSLLQISVINR